jgi:hypothetical protein
MSSSLSLALRIAILLVGISATAACTGPETAELAAATTHADYPLKTCVVSGGKLGGMGKPVAYIHKLQGQPDRTVMFCCKACIRKFEKYPAKFLAKLDAAKTTRVGAQQN